jgi:hypothetical protein
MAPEWAQMDESGEYPLLYETYYACCVNSTWTDYFLGVIESLKDFGIAGIFFDGPVRSPCFCPRCRAKFATEYGLDMSQDSPEQIAQFTRRSVIEFVRKTSEKVKETNPDWLSYINANLLHSKLSAREMKEILSYNHIIGTEGGFQFYGPPKGVDIWRCGLYARLVEAVAGQKRKVIFMAGDHKPWSWYLHTPAETKLCYASTIANGCSVWYGIHCSTPNLDSAAGRAAKGMVSFDKAYADLYDQTRSLADVALFFSFDTTKHYTSSGEQTDFYDGAASEVETVVGNYGDSFQGAFAALFRSGVAFDIVTELNIPDLSRYSVLVVPTGACMSEEIAAAIRAYVRGGGTLIADSETSLYDEELNKRDEFLLSDLFGVSFQAYRGYKTHDYFAFEPEFDLYNAEAVKVLPAPTVALDVSVLEGSQIMARLFPPLRGRYAGRPEEALHPFIVRNQVGKGMCYYLAGTFFELYRDYGITHYKRLIRDIVSRHSAPVVRLLNAPNSVEFTVRKSISSGRVIVHLINYSGAMTRPIEKVIPLRDLALKVYCPCSAARALLCGQELEVGEGGLVALPEISEFEVIVVR